MHAHNTRLNSAITELLIERQEKTLHRTPEEMEAIKAILDDLMIIESLANRKEKIIIVTRMFKKVIETAPHLMWQHPRIKKVVQNRVNEFIKDHRNNVYNDIDDRIHKDFVNVLFKLQSIC